MATYDLEKLVSVHVCNKSNSGYMYEFLALQYKKAKKLFGFTVKKEGFYNTISGFTPLIDVEKEVAETKGRLMMADDKKDIYKAPKVVLKFANSEEYVKYFTTHEEAKAYGEEQVKKSMKNILIT